MNKTPAPNFMDANWLQTERYCNEKIKLAATFELCYLQPFCSQKATIFQPCLRWLQIGGKWLQIGCMLELWPLQHLYSQKAAFLQQKNSLFAAMPLHAWTLTFAAPLQTKSSLFAAKKQSFCSHASDGCKLEAHGCKLAACLTFDLCSPFAAKKQPFCSHASGGHHHPWRRPVMAESLGRATISSLSYGKTSCYLTWLRTTSMYELEGNFRLQVWVQMLHLMQYCTHANTCQSIGWDVSYLDIYSIKILPPD